MLATALSWVVNERVLDLSALALGQITNYSFLIHKEDRPGTHLLRLQECQVTESSKWYQ